MVQFYAIILEEVFMGENSGDDIVYSFSYWTFYGGGKKTEITYKGFVASGASIEA
jgi:hypothetical protein